MAVGTSVYTVMIETHLWTKMDQRQQTRFWLNQWHLARGQERGKGNTLGVCRTSSPGGQDLASTMSDKAASLKTHFYWCMKNSETEIYDVKHHWTCNNNHGDCHPSSRCKTDVNYKPSKTIISDGHDQLLLRKVLERTLIYKSPGDFVHCMGIYIFGRAFQ